jgi:hypothetical protein
MLTKKGNLTSGKDACMMRGVRRASARTGDRTRVRRKVEMLLEATNQFHGGLAGGRLPHDGVRRGSSLSDRYPDGSPRAEDDDEEEDEEYEDEGFLDDDEDDEFEDEFEDEDYDEFEDEDFDDFDDFEDDEDDEDDEFEDEDE